MSSTKPATRITDDGEAKPQRARIESMVLGVLIGLIDGTRPLVSLAGSPNAQWIRARTLVQLGPQDIGCLVGILFEGGNPDLPLIVGCIAGEQARDRTEPLTDVQLDGQRVVLRATQSLVLRCGQSSITLKEDGAIEIRGVNLASRALRRNRIFGGSIDLN
jgi:hypothetical protein